MTIKAGQITIRYVKVILTAIEVSKERIVCVVFKHGSKNGNTVEGIVLREYFHMEVYSVEPLLTSPLEINVTFFVI